MHHACTVSLYNNIEFSQNIFIEALKKIKDICLTINNKLLIKVGMVAPERTALDISDRYLFREQQFNLEDLRKFVEAKKPLFIGEQKSAYDKIINGDKW